MKNLKRSIIITVLVLLFIPVMGNAMTYCDQANEIAKGKDRRTITVKQDGSYKMLLNRGECTSEGLCVVAEMYGACGFITQFVDFNSDGKPDFIIEWQSIVDPTYGVFFTVCTTKNL